MLGYAIRHYVKNEFYVRRKLTSLKEIKVQNQETSGGIEEDHEIAC